MKEKFTQGKWSVVNKNAEYVKNTVILHGKPGKYDAAGGCVDIDARTEANAHLIAAAPKMYRMLNALKDFNCPFEYMDVDEMMAFSNIDKLLAEARGEKA